MPLPEESRPMPLTKLRIPSLGPRWGYLLGKKQFRAEKIVLLAIRTAKTVGMVGIKTGSSLRTKRPPIRN
jgi:hypothetical protein